MKKNIQTEITQAFFNVEYQRNALKQLNLFENEIKDRLLEIHSAATRSVFQESADLIYVKRMNPFVVYCTVKKIFSHPSKLRLLNSSPLNSFEEFIEYVSRSHYMNTGIHLFTIGKEEAGLRDIQI